MEVTVTPDMMRETQSAILNALESATQITKSYLSAQENMNAAGVWQGDAVTASHMTAQQLSEDLIKTITGGNRLAEGLGSAATLMEAHEDQSKQELLSVFNAPSSGGPSPL